MIIAHIVTEPLCKILCKKALFSKGRFFRRHSTFIKYKICLRKLWLESFWIMYKIHCNQETNTTRYSLNNQMWIALLQIEPSPENKHTFLVFDRRFSTHNQHENHCMKSSLVHFVNAIPPLNISTLPQLQCAYLLLYQTSGRHVIVLIE